MRTNPENSLGVAIANYLKAREALDNVPGDFIDSDEDEAMMMAGVNVATCAPNVSSDQEAIAALELVMLEAGFLEKLSAPLIRGVLMYLKRKQ